jgi:Ca2+-binding EF-hand superfamily protein
MNGMSGIGIAQGYIQKSDLASVLEKVVSVSKGSTLKSDNPDIDELLSKIDTDGNGKVRNRTNQYVYRA